MSRLIASFIVALLLVGCASTQVTGFRDRAYQSVSYVRPVVAVRIDDLQHKVAIEDLFVKEFSSHEIFAIKGTALYPPTRQFTEEELTQVFVESPADSIIGIVLKDGSTERTQIWVITVVGKDVGNVVWTGESKTNLLESNVLEGMNLGTMFSSVSKNVVNRLIEDKVFQGSVENNRSQSP